MYWIEIGYLVKNFLKFFHLCIWYHSCLRSTHFSSWFHLVPCSFWLLYLAEKSIRLLKPFFFLMWENRVRIVLTHVLLSCWMAWLGLPWENGRLAYIILITFLYNKSFVFLGNVYLCQFLGRTFTSFKSGLVIYWPWWKWGYFMANWDGWLFKYWMLL